MRRRCLIQRIVPVALLALTPLLCRGQPNVRSEPERRGAGTPLPADADLAQTSAWLYSQDQRLALLGAPPSTGWCRVINVFPRPEVLSAAEWQRLAGRCAEEIRSGSRDAQLEALRFAMTHLRSATFQRPELTGAFPPELLRSVTGALDSPDHEVRRHALMCVQFARMLSLAPLEAVPGVLRALEDADVTLRRLAAQALSAIATDARGERVGLGEHGPTAVAALLRAIEDQDRMVKAFSYSALASMTEAGSAAVPVLSVRLQSADPGERRLARCTLEGLGPYAAGAVPALSALLTSRDEYERMFTARTLGAIGSAAASATPGLVSGLRDANNDVAIMCADALGRIGPRAAAALPSLRAAVGADPGAFGGRGASAIEQIEGSHRP
jgi:HEAT repeat protein